MFVNRKLPPTFLNTYPLFYTSIAIPLNHANAKATLTPHDQLIYFPWSTLNRNGPNPTICNQLTQTPQIYLNHPTWWTNVLNPLLVQRVITQILIWFRCDWIHLYKLFIVYLPFSLRFTLADYLFLICAHWASILYHHT